jgi:hypothetical protein
MAAAAVATVAPSAPPPGLIPDSNPAPYKKQKSGEQRPADADAELTMLKLSWVAPCQCCTEQPPVDAALSMLLLALPCSCSGMLRHLGPGTLYADQKNVRYPHAA